MDSDIVGNMGSSKMIKYFLDTNDSVIYTINNNVLSLIVIPSVVKSIPNETHANPLYIRICIFLFIYTAPLPTQQVQSSNSIPRGQVTSNSTI